MSLEEEVKAHTRRVEAGQPLRYCEACPRCGVDEEFRVHDCRSRTFRLVVDGCAVDKNVTGLEVRGDGTRGRPGEIPRGGVQQSASRGDRGDDGTDFRFRESGRRP